MSNITTAQPNQTLWQKLIEPHPGVSDPGTRARARILAIVVLVLSALTVAVTTATVVLGGETRGAVIALALFASSYVLNRTRWPAIGAAILVYGLVAQVFIFMSVLREPGVVTATLAFAPIPVVLATLVMRSRGSILVSAVIVVGLIAATLLLPWVQPSQVIIPTVATALIASVASASAFLRERDVTLIQKQADDLNRYSESLEAEIRNVITTAQVGQAITGTRNVDQLLKQVSNLIVERFDLFYHAQVFLVDEARQLAILRESTGEAGARLLARNHRLAVGSQSVIGQVTENARPIVVSDTDIDPVHRRNELLPNTRSEMALPLIAGGQVIGALDIQSTHPNAFRESDIRVFQTMADQLSVAIENARLFERAQRDLQEIETLNRRLTGEGWRRFEQSRSASAPMGFEATSQGVRPVLPGEESSDQGEGTLTLPLLVRGEPIGMIDVMPRSGEAPDPEMRTILEQVAERVALALDSTRLSEQALRQAEREQVLSRLSAELQATTDLDLILKAAAREASRALGTPRGFVHLIMEYGEAKAEAAADS